MKESQLQADIIKALEPHVAWCMSITTGKVKVKGTGFINIGMYRYEGKSRYGISDIIGQMSAEAGGKLFALEVKLPDKEPSELQYEFLEIVNNNGGLGAWCTSVEGALNIITGWQPKEIA